MIMVRKKLIIGILLVSSGYSLQSGDTLGDLGATTYCFLPPSTPRSVDGLGSPAPVVHRKCGPECLDPVHQVKDYSSLQFYSGLNYDRGYFDHRVEVVCVVVATGQLKDLTKDQQNAAVVAHVVPTDSKTRRLKPCLKY